MKEIVADVKGLQIGSVVVGTAYNTYYNWISKIIAEFVKVYPDINIKIIEDTSSHLASMLEEGYADFCIMSRREGDFRFSTLKEDNLVVWVPKNHPAVEKGFFPRKQLAKEPFIELFPDLETDNSRFLKQNKIKVNTKYSTADAFALSHMVEAGLGITLTNELYSEMLPGAIVALPLSPNEKVDVGIAIPHKEKCSPAVKKFIEFAEKYYESVLAK
ncbi:MAG: LysR family transcriptional regulator substrate-binding protein [Oscillospiraceae bacterium]|nr:LysR family transcriptional regulator substrate-binding protein [Oscillospiraceae bacterium]